MFMLGILVEEKDRENREGVLCRNITEFHKINRWINRIEPSQLLEAAGRKLSVTNQRMLPSYPDKPREPLATSPSRPRQEKEQIKKKEEITLLFRIPFPHDYIFHVFSSPPNFHF